MSVSSASFAVIGTSYPIIRDRCETSTFVCRNSLGGKHAQDRLASDFIRIVVWFETVRGSDHPEKWRSVDWHNSQVRFQDTCAENGGSRGSIYPMGCD